MPSKSTRTRWVTELTDNYTRQQRRRLNRELDSDDSMSNGSASGEDIEIEDPNDPAMIHVALASLNEEIAELSLDLDLEMLDLELSDIVGDVGDVEMGLDDPPSPASPSSSDMEDELELNSRDRLADLLKYMDENRVLEPQPPNPKVSQLHLLDHWAEHNLRSFRAKLRVHPTTFQRILDLLKDHHVFHNNSNSEQLPVNVQLAIYLSRAGHYGNGSSAIDIATWAGVSVGLVRKATIRVMVALISLHDTAIHLPTQAEKEASKQWVEDACCPEWRGGFITVDGTKFPLFQRPGLHGDAWYDKNKDYSADCQVVNLLHNLLIVDYSIGHTGSVHDSWAFRSTRTFKEHETILRDGEWLWADSAYPCETWCVCPFKKPVGGRLTADQRTYNYHVSKVRIRSEHAIGLLKGTFQCLKEIRLQVSDNKKHLELILLIRCCIILHNLIIRIEEETGVDEEWRQTLINEGLDNGRDEGDDQDPEAPQADAHPGQIFRHGLMDKLFNSEFTQAQRRPEL